MTLDEIRSFWKHQPFEPFEILLVDGRTFQVPHPDFIFVPPGKGTWVFVGTKRGVTEHINTVVISSIRRTTGNGTRTRRKAG